LKEEHLVVFNRNQRQDDSVQRSYPLADKIQTIPNQSYAETDNPRQQLDLYLPKNCSSNKPLPVVVFIEMTDAGHGFKSYVLDERIKQFFDLLLRGVLSEIDTTPIDLHTK